MALSRRRAQNKRIEPQFSLPTFGVQQKLGVAFTVLVLGLIITLLYIVESRYRTSIVAQVEKRGATIADQLAAVSRNALMTYDWIALIQDVNNVSRDPDVLYALILQRDGEPVAESKDPSFLGNPLLPEHVSQKAIETLETLVQYIPKGVNVPSVITTTWQSPFSRPRGKNGTRLASHSRCKKCTRKSAKPVFGSFWLAVLAVLLAWWRWHGSPGVLHPRFKI